MKGEIVTPQYKALLKVIIFFKLFLDIQILRGCHHARCVDVFVENKNVWKATWTIHVIKIHVT